MACETFVIVVDTPSIKNYVFGTDPLNEVRGSSAWLDQLNRSEMEQCLHKHLGKGHVERVYANGGSAQFLIHGCERANVGAACASMVQHIREQTAGEVGVVYGIAPLSDESTYSDAVRIAHFQLRGQREFATCQRSAALIPIIEECHSASHLPASHDDENRFSQASYEKRQHGSDARRHGLWAQWMKHLAAHRQSWPSDEYWNKLRCESLTDIGDYSLWSDYIGLIYADGNDMGKIIKTLDLPETYRQFSRIVDESIQEACFTALNQVSESEIDNVQQALKSKKSFKSLPADILLLGGDDLLVALPADRALDFALKATETFQHLTQEKINALKNKKVQEFFHEKLDDEGFTISCGVAIAKSNYPFYLLLDLAEELLKSAKKKDNHYLYTEADGRSRIDFHVVAGANSYALPQVREETYLTKVDAPAPRTLRPLSCRQLKQLRKNVQNLQKAGSRTANCMNFKKLHCSPTGFKRPCAFRRFLRDVSMDKINLSDVLCGNQLPACAQKDTVLIFHGSQRTANVCYVSQTWWMHPVYFQGRKEFCPCNLNVWTCVTTLFGRGVGTSAAVTSPQ